MNEKRDPQHLSDDALVTLEQLERRAIEEALRRTNGDKGKAAALLGTSRAKIYERLKRWRDNEQDKKRLS